MTVFERIDTTKGIGAIREYYNNALVNSNHGKGIGIDEFRTELWPHFYRNRIITNNGQDFELDDSDYFDHFWELFNAETAAELRGCCIHTGQSQNGYPVVSVRLTSEEGNLAGMQKASSSLKLNLHWVPFFQADDTEEITTEKIQSLNNSVFAHRCHEKLCLTHAVKSTIKFNIGQNYCKVFQIVDDELHRICHCINPCLVPGISAWSTQVN